jgi:hypothetical protein
MVQGFIFEGDLQFSKLFKNTICKGVCQSWALAHFSEVRYPLPTQFFPLDR